MKEATKLISEDIESGKYFTEARSWFNKVHLQPLSEIFVMFIVLSALAFMLFTLLVNIYGVFPVTTKVKTVVFMPNTINYYPTLKKIGEKNKTTREVVAQYLCKRYVIAREAYDYPKLSSSYNFIFRSSSKQLFDEYYQALALSNPDSPIVLYKDQNTVTVDINEETIQTDNGTGVIKFTTNLYDKRNKLVSSRKLTANIAFYLDENYNFEKSVDSKLDFIVTKYDVQEITQ